MSIVVAVQKEGQIYIAADTQTVFGQSRLTETHRTEKVLRVGDSSSFIGHVGHGLYEDLLVRFLSPDESETCTKLTTKAGVFDFFLRFYMKMLADGLIVNQQPDDKETPFAGLGAAFVVANPHGIFHVCSDLGTTPVERYIAIGSGAQYALGAIYTLYGQDDTSACSLASAGVLAAMAFDIYCGGEVAIYPVVEPVSETLKPLQER